MKTRLRLLVSALGVVFMVTGIATAAHAAGHGTTARHAANATVGSAPVKGAHLRAASGLPCWTSFSNNHPGGGPMTEYYNNCSSSTVTVCPIYVENPSSINSGHNWAYCGPGEVLAIAAGNVGYWDFSATYTTGYYSTALWS